MQRHGLKQKSKRQEVRNHVFETLSGTTLLTDLFAGKDTLLMIHNMGQGCGYCMLWGDGLNGFLPHLEATMAVAMVSRDDPEIQQRYANSRQWRLRMASHGGGDCITEQTTVAGSNNVPGVVCYHRDGERILRTNSATFGPVDLNCSICNFLAQAGLTKDDWTPQYHYWQRPARLDNGGANLLE